MSGRDGVGWLIAWFLDWIFGPRQQEAATRIAVFDDGAEQKEGTMGKPLSNTTKSRTLNLVPQTAGGKAAKVQAGSMTGESSDETKITVEVAADGASAKIRPVAGAVSDVDADGVAVPIKFTFSGDADLGAGVRTISGEYECVLAEEEATGLVVEEGDDEL